MKLQINAKTCQKSRALMAHQCLIARGDSALRVAKEVRTYSAGIDRGTFEQQEVLKCEPIQRNLELIGEASALSPAKGREHYAGIPCRQVIVTRNRSAMSISASITTLFGAS